MTELNILYMTTLYPCTWFTDMIMYEVLSKLNIIIQLLHKVCISIHFAYMP